MAKIVIPLFDTFDIETYDGLIGFIEEHLELDAETTAQIPTFIRLAEYKLNRMILAPERETSAELETSAGVPFVSLPTGFRQLRTAYIDAGYVLDPVTLNVVNQYDYAGTPICFTISNEALYFGPIPDAAYTVTITYLERLAPITPTNQTNWLLSGNADAYVYAVLMQAEAFLGHDERVPMFAAALAETIGEVNAQGNRFRNASPMRLRSPGIIV